MSAKKRALGRGLGSLIKSIDEGNETLQDKITEIPLDKLDVNPYQPRKEFDEENIINLANSIKENQLLNPITVKKSGDRYIIISGERRFRASQYLKLKTIKAIVIDVSDEELSIYSLLENIQRVDLNDIEKGLAAKNIKDKFKLTDEQLAQKLGVSRSTVTNYLRLLKLDDYIKDALNSNKLTTGQVRPLIGLDEENRKEIFNKIIEENLTSREIENLVSSLKHKKNKKGDSLIDSNIKEKYKNHLNKRFKNIKKTKKGYELSLIFENIDQLNKFLGIDE